MRRALLGATTVAMLSACAIGGPGAVVTGQPLPSGAPADACAPEHVAAMAGRPAADAIAANPGLAGLHAGLDRAGLRTTLNAASALTVFATTDEFLAVFPFHSVPGMWDNQDHLAQLLKQAVVAERLTPDRLPGVHTTMSGTRAVVTADADGPRVNDTSIRCQALDGTNATIYLVDTLPPQR